MAVTAIVPVSVLWVKRSVFSGERPTSCYETRLCPLNPNSRTICVAQ